MSKRTTVFWIILLIFMIVVGISLVPAMAITTGTYYKLVNVNSGKVLGISQMSTADGGAAVQWSDNGTADHNWRLDLQSNGYYKLTNQNSGKVLGVNGMSTADGAQVLQWSDNGTADHEWKFDDMGNGSYRITNRNSGKVLDVSGASTADGANIVQWTNNGGNSQRWTLVEIGSATPTPTLTPSSNLITNPDFETGNSNGWTINGAGAIAVSSAQKHTGVYSLLHTGRTATWNGPLQNLTSKVQNGTVYLCSGWVRLDNTASTSVIMTIKKTDSNGTTYTNIASGTASNSSWIQLSGSYSLAVSGTLTELSIYFEGPTSGINYYIDDISVTTGGTTPPPTPTPTSTSTPPATSYLQRMEPTGTLKINSSFWNARVKNIMVNWIPYLESQLSNTSLAEGGIQNFVNAGNKLAGRSYSSHVGYVFSNAYTLNTIEAMCAALMIDPQGDSTISSAQSAMRTKLSDWIPKILSAQESDGYLQTYITLNGTRWSYNGNHEGYVAGYFIEAGIMHYLMTNKTDATLYNAAKKLADCWCNNIGPGKAHPTWWDDHEEMEQASCRLGVFVNQNEGAGIGDKYIQLAKVLLDNRHGGSSYSQSQDYPYNQRTVVGHAVRSMYLCSGMTDVAMLLNASNYTTAVNALWDNFVNRKLYVTGGVGSGETSEGYGNDYSLPNATAYCESCAGCGALFFQNKMNLLYGDGKYADLMELELYNAVLGAFDLNANNFTYTNPLDSSSTRYKWHNCPCCVGNIPKTILEFVRWMYAKSGDNSGIYVNMYIGSTYTIPDISGTDVQLVQTTNYPWETNVTITVNPTTPKAFTIYLHSPDRSISTCYSSNPSVNGLNSIAVNGATVTNTVTKGYVAINRTWTAGDKITFTVQMSPQRVKAINNVAADAGRVALQYGPLIYNLESVDQNVDLILNPSSALTAQWNASLLGGVMTIKGTFTNGAVMTAIPNYARLNRGGRSLVWLKDQ